MWFKRKTEVCHLLLANISTSLLDTPEEGSKISHHYSSRSYSKQQEMVKYSGNIMLLWRAKALKKNVPEVLSDTGKKTSACLGQKETKHSRWKVHLVIGFIILNTEREIQLFCWEKKKVFFIFVFCSKWTQQWKNYFQQQQQKSQSNQLPIWWQLLINSHIRNPHPTRPGCWEERSKGLGSCFTLFVHCIPHLPSSYIAHCFQ